MFSIPLKRAQLFHGADQSHTLWFLNRTGIFGTTSPAGTFLLLLAEFQIRA